MTSEEINKLFRKFGRTLGSVESFTGGLFSETITAVPGASHFYKGGFVTYASEEKNRLLGISYDTIDQYGVVSQEVAAAMASNAQKLLNVDYCVSFTGNAGPSAMENKPVGEVYIGLATSEKVEAFPYQLEGERNKIQEKAINLAFTLLADALTK